MSKKTNAAILIIGNEILSGRTQDTNTSTLATWLNSIGVKVEEVRVIPDVENIIVETLNLLRQRDGFFKVIKLKNTYEKPSEKKKRILQENIKRVKKLNKLKNRI